MKRLIILSTILAFNIAIYAQKVDVNTQQDSIAFHQSFLEKSSLKSAVLPQSTAEPYSGNFFVGGNENTYYPVAFQDGGWRVNRATILEIGRSDTHTDSSWRGSLIATFKFHTFHWGHGSNFIDADIKQDNRVAGRTFIAGWQDASIANNSYNVIIWLRGNSTYYFYSNFSQSPISSNAAIVLDGITFEPKVNIESYVNSFGMTYAYNIKSLGTGTNFFEGDVKIGKDTERKLDVNGTMRGWTLDCTDTSTSKLKSVLARLSEGNTTGKGTFLGVKSYDSQPIQSKSFSIEHSFYGSLNSSINFYRGSGTTDGTLGIAVNNGTEIARFSSTGLDVGGTIRAREVKIEITAGADHVFKPNYELKPLSEVESFISENNHLPEIPSEKQMQEEGLSVNEFQIKLLQKIEELTLYTIQQNKTIEDLNKRINQLEKNK